MSNHQKAGQILAAVQLLVREVRLRFPASTGGGFPLSVDVASGGQMVRALVEGMVGSRTFSAAPILADALQEAGCDADEWLRLLRDPAQPWFACAKVLTSLS